MQHKAEIQGESGLEVLLESHKILIALAWHSLLIGRFTPAHVILEQWCLPPEVRILYAKRAFQSASPAWQCALIGTLWPPLIKYVPNSEGVRGRALPWSLISSKYLSSKIAPIEEPRGLSLIYLIYCISLNFSPTQLPSTTREIRRELVSKAGAEDLHLRYPSESSIHGK